MNWTSVFTAAVLIVANKVGLNPSRIADEISELLFPETLEAVREEGFEAIFRRGLTDNIKAILKHNAALAGDPGDIEAGLRRAVSLLRSYTYTVPSVGARVPIIDLIKRPVHLREASALIRQKGDEIMDEADRLDRLYSLVTDSQTDAANDPGTKKAAKKAA